MRDDSVAGIPNTASTLVTAFDTGSSSDDVENEKYTRDTEEGALNADDNIDDNSHDESGAVTLNHRGVLISRGNKSSILLTERSLPMDTFSFIIISGPFSLSFLIAIIVFSFQIAIFSLVSVDVIDLSNSRNPFNFPPNVESTVRATQVLAIIIAIVTQDDVKKVILILRDGYTADVIQGAFGPDATKFKWILSLVLRAAEGLVGLFVTFMLIMQSKTVLDLLLNFSAMEFVSLLDDGAFLMLREGYFGIGMMKQATLCQTKYYVSHALSLKSSRLSAMYFIIIFAVMFSGWIGIYSDQARGEYLCQRMYIQVDKAPTISFLSGTYTVNHDEEFSGRVTSSQENGIGKVGYCADKNVWTLTIHDPQDQDPSMIHEYDPCLYWVARSSESFEFDVINTASSQWYAQMSDGGGEAAFIVDIELICAICDNHKNTCLNGGVCSPDDSCDCKDDATGFFCQIQPTHNGHCNNAFFNTPEYNYDGGDCCESSCVSTDKYTCGKDAYGIVDIGYPQCKNKKIEPYDKWFKSGISVNGVSVDARSGAAVALGGRGGTVLVVGDPGASVVRLFDKDGSKWVQRGEALIGPTDSQFGHDISLVLQDEDVKKNNNSSPILTLAVGTTNGVVRVYECQKSSCKQIGSEISSSGMFASLSRASGGTRVAIGPNSYTSTRIRLAIGSNADAWPVIVEVYEYDIMLENWQMIGNFSECCPLVDKRDLAILLVPAVSYHDAVLSGDGQVLVIGTSTVHEFLSEGGPTNDNYDDATMIVTTYRWNATISDWDVMEDKGGSLSTNHDKPQATTWLQNCIALSDNGTVLVVCSKLGIAVYSWSVDKSTWVPRDVVFDFNKTSTSLAGLSVDISSDGSTLAIGSDISIWAFKWNGTHYTQHFNSLPSGKSSAVSLSRDGNALAVGNPSSGNNEGVTTVYKVRSLGCKGYDKLLRISFTTDDKPEESRWTLHIGNETIQSQPYDGLPLTTFVKDICVPTNVCIKFRAYDTTGNGIQDPGGYSVMLDGEEKANGNDFGFGETKFITGDCNCPAGLTLLSIMAKDSSGSDIPMEWALSYQNKTAEREYVFIRTMDHDIEIFEECIPEGCWHLTNPQCDGVVIYDKVNTNWWYSITYKGWSETKSRGWDQFCPQGDETISFGECLPGENVKVKSPTNPPTSSPWPTYNPTISASPTMCTGNTYGWNPMVGMTWDDYCKWFEDNDVPGCEIYGAEDGATAKENCCYCSLEVSNNPMQTFNPTQWPTRSGPTISPYPTYFVSPTDFSTTLAAPSTITSETMPPTKPSLLTKFDELTAENEDEKNDLGKGT